MSDDRTPRMVMPRRWMIAGSLATLSAPAFAQSGEGGEAGEGAMVATLDPEAEFLTELGLFEATHRIVLELVAANAPDLAREHLEQSHHASYEDLVDDLDEQGVPGFEAEATAFATAIEEGGNPVAAGATVLAAIQTVVMSAPPADQIKAAETLVRLAYEDFQAGVDAGEVVAPQEYRDAWGFVEVARRRLMLLAASGDTTVAAAGTAALEALEPTKALFPGITAETVGEDASILAGAAARIEIAGLRIK